MLGLPHEHGSKPELPGYTSPGKDFFLTLILFNYLFIFDGRGFLLLHMAFLSFW